MRQVAALLSFWQNSFASEHTSRNRIEASKKLLKTAHAERRVFKRIVSQREMDAHSWDVHPVPLVDLQAADQVSLDGKAPLQLGGPTGQVAGEAASHEVALLAGALGAEHLVGEQRDDGVDVATSISLEIAGDVGSIKA